MTQGNADLDVAIVGTGPAGMFCAHRLLGQQPNRRVCLIDKGSDITMRLRQDSPLRFHGDRNPTSLISGAGGTGLFSDGKLLLTLAAGGKVGSELSPELANSYVKYVEDVLVSYDGYSRLPKEQVNAKPGERLQIGRLKYKHLPVRHFSTAHLAQVVQRFFEDLSQFPALSLLFNSKVLGLERDHKVFTLNYLGADGKLKALSAERVVFAVGKEGSPWLTKTLRRFGVRTQANRTFFGVRVETHASKEISRYSGDPKLFWHFEDGTKIKTHCFCWAGEVLALEYFGFPLAGAHSPTIFTGQLGHRSNFGVLLGDTKESRFTWSMCMEYLRAVRRRSDGALLVQRYGDFINKIPTTWAGLSKNSVKPSCKRICPGDISSVDLPFGFRAKLQLFLARMEKLEPGLISPDSLLYAPSIEWWMPRIQTDAGLQTMLKGVYVAGDGAGLSQGIMHASATGLMAAESILRR